MAFTAEEAALPDEVVTRAATRLVTMPGLDKPVALITVDRTGVSERVNGKPFLAPGVASVPVA